MENVEGDHVGAGPPAALHEPALTAAQRRFADVNAATPIMNGEAHADSVYMYRIDPTHTVRWLVDRHGAPIEATTFRH